MMMIEKQDISKLVQHMKAKWYPGRRRILISIYRTPHLQGRLVGLTSCLAESPMSAVSRAVTETMQMAGTEDADKAVFPLWHTTERILQ